MAEAMLEAEGLRAGYGPAEILFGVSLRLARGEVAALMGRNGAGKSTTLKAIMGLIPPRAGRVRFMGRDIAGLAAFRIARQSRIGVLFTEHDMDAVFAHADRILVLVRGEIIAAGSPEEVRANAEVQRVYLGTSGLRAALRARAAVHG